MRKKSTRTILFSLVIAASICSYVFLNAVSFCFEDAAAAPQNEQQVMEEELDSNTTEIYVPDVAVIKKFLEASRKILTSTF